MFNSLDVVLNNIHKDNLFSINGFAFKCIKCLKKELSLIFIIKKTVIWMI